MQIDLYSAFQNHYLANCLRIQSGETIRQYRYALECFERMLGHMPTTADLRDENIVSLLRWFVGVREVTPQTANAQVGRIKTLWTWLAKRGMVPTFPTAGRLPEPERMPTAWTREQLAMLYHAAADTPGQIAGIDAGAWWQALLVWLWNTGERYGATMAVEWRMVVGDVVTIPAASRKGRRKTAVYRLWPDTLAHLERIRTADARVFPWDRCKGMYWIGWSSLLKRAGLPNGRDRKTQSMRVSHATWLAIRGGDASRSLMHSDPATTRAHYIDPRLGVATPDLFRIDGPGD